MPLLEQVLGQYPQEVKLVFKHFPLQGYVFAVKAATAAMAAGIQGKFWEFHDLLFKNYDQLNDQKVKEIVQQLGLNEQEFGKRMDDPEVVKKIQQDTTDGINADVDGIPAIFINGKLLRNRSMEGFKKMIDKELSKTREKR